MRKQGNTTSRGFTLIELIVVLLLMSVLAAMLVPSLRSFSVSQSNRFAATQFLAQLRYARTQAVTEGKTYRVIIDANSGEFYVAADNGGGTFEPVPADLGQKVTVADGVKIETDLPTRDDGNSAATYVEIRGNGLTDPGRVTFRNARNETVDVVCESATEQYHIPAVAQ